MQENALSGKVQVETNKSDYVTHGQKTSQIWLAGSSSAEWKLALRLAHHEAQKPELNTREVAS